MCNYSNNSVEGDQLYQHNWEFLRSMGPTIAYLALLMVLGLVGNTLVFVVYYRRFRPSTTRTYVLAMSVTDLLTNLLALPSDILETRYHYDFHSDATCKFFGYITRFLALLGGCVLVAVAVDRHRKICHPTKRQKTAKYVYIELASLVVFTLCFSVPFAVLRGIQTIKVRGSDQLTGCTCSIADAYVQSSLFVGYNRSMMVALVITVVIMTVCYSLIARHIWRHRQRQKDRRATTTTITAQRGTPSLAGEVIISFDDQALSDEDYPPHVLQLSASESETPGTAELTYTTGDRPAEAQEAVSETQRGQNSEDKGQEGQRETLAEQGIAETVQSGHNTEGKEQERQRETPVVHTEQGIVENVQKTTDWAHDKQTIPQGLDCDQNITDEVRTEHKTDRIHSGQASDVDHSEAKSTDVIHNEHNTKDAIHNEQNTTDGIHNAQNTNYGIHNEHNTKDGIHNEHDTKDGIHNEHNTNNGVNKEQKTPDDISPKGSVRLQSCAQNSEVAMGVLKNANNTEHKMTANSAVNFATGTATANSDQQNNTIPTTNTSFEKADSKVAESTTSNIQVKPIVDNTKTSPAFKPRATKIKSIPRRTTLMMFVLTATFIVSYLPYVVMAAVHKGKDRLGVEFWLLNAEQIALRSFFLNSAVNPFVYGFCCGRFRQELKSLLCSIAPGKRITRQEWTGTS